MTKEQIKNALPLIQAFAEGRTIQTKNGERWIDIDDKDDLNIESIAVYPDCFRIKIEEKTVYRPFRNAEECWQEMLKHQPFGVALHKRDRAYIAFECLDNGICNFNGYREVSFKSAFDDIQFADGTPFGIKYSYELYSHK